MFWNTKEIAKLTAKNKQRSAALLQLFQDSLEKAEKTSDPSNRLLILLEIKETIKESRQMTVDDVYLQKNDILRKTKNIGLGIMGIGCIGIVLTPFTSLAFTLPLLAYFAGAAITVRGMLHPNKETQTLENDKRDLLNKMDTLEETIGQNAEAVMQAHMSELFASKDIKTLSEKVPVIRDAFIDAAIAKNVFAPAPQPQSTPSPQP